MINTSKLVANGHENYDMIFMMLMGIRTATGKKSFAYQGGALMFNDLDKSLRDERSLLKFKERISNAH